MKDKTSEVAPNEATPAEKATKPRKPAKRASRRAAAPATAAQAPVSRYEQIEAEYRLEMIADMREKREARETQRAHLAVQRQQAAETMRKDAEARANRQRKCKHRKGGRNNNFAKGTAAEYSINMNTYPDGTKVLMCTRCFQERVLPHKKLRRSNPELYARMLKDWNEWAELPTDNTPSGSQIFLVESAA